MANQPNDARASDTTQTGATGIRPSDSADTWNGTDVGGADVGGIGAMDPRTEAGAKGGQAVATRGAAVAGEGDGPIEEATEIPYHEWQAFFDSFSKRHAGKPVRVEVGTAQPGWPINSVTQRLADGLPLVGIVADLKDGDEVGSVEVIVGTDPEAQISHTVWEPTHVWLAQTSSEVDRAVQIESATDPSILIRL